MNQPDHTEICIKSLTESLASAPVEDEELNPETVAEIERAHASLARGEGIPHSAILREFGLLDDPDASVNPPVDSR